MSHVGTTTTNTTTTIIANYTEKNQQVLNLIDQSVGLLYRHPNICICIHITKRGLTFSGWAHDFSKFLLTKQVDSNSSLHACRRARARVQVRPGMRNDRNKILIKISSHQPRHQARQHSSHIVTKAFGQTNKLITEGQF